MSGGLEVRLHSVLGLPTAGTVVVAEIHFADGTTWTSAPAFSHGGTAYVGAWIAVYLPAGEGTQLSFKVHDHSSSGVVQCSGGSVSAWGTLELPAAAAAAGAGWRHATLELQAGRATRLTQKLEQALADAGDRVGDRMEAVADATSRAGSKHMAPGEPADAAAAVSEPEAAAAAPEAGAAGVPAVEAVTPEGGSDGAAPAGAAAAETTADASEAGQGASSAAEGSAAADDLEADILAAGCVRLRLSFRPLQPAPSALLLRQLAGTAAEAEAAAAAGLRGKKSVIRLLPQPGASEAKEAAGGGAGAAAAAEVEAEEGRRPPGAEPPLEGAGADQMLPIELPLEALPRHLHSYGHGAFMGAALSLIGSQRWQAILKQEDPSGFHSARRVASKLGLVGQSHNKLGLTKAYLALMPVLENNPVLAAYGAVRSGSAEMVGLPAAAAAAAGSGGGGKDSVSGAAPAPAGAGSSGTEVGVQEPAGGPAGTDSANSGGGDGGMAPPAQQEMSTADTGSGDGGASAAPAAAKAAAAEEAHEAELQRAAAKLAAYLEAQKRPNRYGYLPIAQEWDIWVNPTAPADLRGAGVSHGSAGQLVTQAITTAMPCTRTCARSAGQALISRQAMPPVSWLNAFGHAINAAVSGDRATPLPLGGEPEQHWRLRIALRCVGGLPTDAWERPYLKAKLFSATVALPKCRTGRGKPHGATAFVWGDGDGGGGGGGGKRGAAVSFWPLPLDLASREAVTFELRGDPAGVLNDSSIGTARLPLLALSEQFPGLLAGEAVQVHLPLAPAEGSAKQGGAGATAAAAAGQPARADGSRSDEEEEEEEEEGEGLEEGQAGALGGPSAAPAAAEASGAAPPPCDGLAEADSGPSVAPSARPGAFGRALASAALAVSGAAVKVVNTVAIPAAALFKPDAAPAEQHDALTGAASAASASAGGVPTLSLTLRLERMSALEAAEAAGVTPAAAQTCLAMLSEPGGLFLDVKSAYSTPHDLQLFVSTLRGMGLHTKAVCSFQPKQLKIPPGVAHTVLFFHGLSGLENACDAGQIRPGQFVLFNGASFLTDLSKGGMQLPEDRAAELLATAVQHPVDPLVLRRYRSLVEQYGFAGGIYVQEPDTSASSVQALICMLSADEAFFPLGFAYGHLRDAAVSVVDLAGRGFASQEILEELASRDELSNKVVARINRGEHRTASTNARIAWAGRLVNSSKLLSVKEQRALLALAAEVPSGDMLLALAEELGGIERIILRFHAHYEATTPMTLLEAGFNHNYQKSLLRMLRNKGALAALPVHKKIELGRFFCGPQLRGYGLTYLLQFARLRTGLHKHAKEGLLCLLESCTAAEHDKVLLALGGRAKVARRLRGRLRMSWRYTRRLQDVEDSYAALGPESRAYQNPALKYAALQAVEPGELEKLGSRAYLHTRDKTGLEQGWRCFRKLGCCACTTCNCLCLNFWTVGLFSICCFCPRVLGATFKGTFSMSAALAMVLGFIVAVGVWLMLLSIIPDGVVGM